MRMFLSTVDYGPKMRFIKGEMGHLVLAAKVLANPAGLVENKGLKGVTL